MQVFYKNPNLLHFDMGDNFYALANPLIDFGIKIISSPQKHIFDFVDGKNNTNDISKLSGFETSIVNNTLSNLKRIKAVSENDVFKPKQQQEESKEFLTLWVHTTDRCNLGCSYCYIPTIRTPSDVNLEVLSQLQEKLIEAVDEHGTKRLNVRLAGGEPFSKFNLWKDWVVELKQVFKDKDCHLHIGCLTNMTILNDEIINFVKKHKIGLGISLDGIGKWHDSTRVYVSGRPSYKTVSKNIERLLEEDVPFNIMVVASNHNIGGLLEATKYFIKNDIPFRISDVKGEDFNRKGFREELEKCYSEIENSIEKGYSFSKLHSLCDLNLGMVSPNPCSMGKNGAAIYLDGGVYFCHTQFKEEEPVGYLNEESDIFTTIHRGKSIFLNEDKHDDCKSCKFRLVCASGCPVYRTDDNKSPECELFHSMIPRIFYLMAKEKLVKIKNNQTEH